MKIQYISDLHLEFETNRIWLEENPISPLGDVLVIAGDTYYLEKDYSQLDFIKWAGDNFEKVFLIPGNHEYYGGFDAATAMHAFQENVLDNVVLINNASVDINGVQLVFSTLWSNIIENAVAITRGMVDFRKIRFNGEEFTTDDFNLLHEYAFAFINRAIKKEGKKVVVTHHLPSPLCNAPEFMGSLLNDAFCVDKTDFIEKSDIDYWIYGHSHRNLADFEINGTQLVTNQMGYVDWNEQHSFQLDKWFEIE